MSTEFTATVVEDGEITPAIPEWVTESIETVKTLTVRWGTTTVELLHELYSARERLSQRGRPKNGSSVPFFLWRDYCRKAGLNRRTVNRWLRNYDPETKQKLIAAPMTNFSLTTYEEADDDHDFTIEDLVDELGVSETEATELIREAVKTLPSVPDDETVVQRAINIYRGGTFTQAKKEAKKRTSFKEGMKAAAAEIKAEEPKGPTDPVGKAANAFAQRAHSRIREVQDDAPDPDVDPKTGLTPEQQDRLNRKVALQEWQNLRDDLKGWVDGALPWVKDAKLPREGDLAEILDEIEGYLEVIQEAIPPKKETK